MSKTYNWGIIGLGRIAHKFAEDLGKLKNTRLHAVASRSEDRARAFAGQYGAAHFFGSYEGIVSCPDLDVVYVATPHVLHCENTLMCLQNRIPVLCEKPFAMNAGEVNQMIRAANSNQTFLMEAFWTRFHPTTGKVLELIENGAIGELLSLKADLGFKAPFEPEKRLFNRNLGGGALLDIGIYPVFLSLLVLGKPVSIKAAARIGSTQVDEECGIILQYPAGNMAHLHSTFLTHTKSEAFIYGKDGTIHWHTRWQESNTMSLVRDGERPQDFRFEFLGLGYAHEAKEVMKCLAEGKLENELLPLSFSRDLMDLLDAIRQEAGIVYI